MAILGKILDISRLKMANYSTSAMYQMALSLVMIRELLQG
jgi:hypothetical protein